MQQNSVCVPVGLPRAVLCATVCFSALWYETTHKHLHMLLHDSQRIILASQANSTETSLTLYPVWWRARGLTQNLQFPTRPTLNISLVRQILSTVVRQCAPLFVRHGEPWYCSAWEPLVRRACNKSWKSLWGLAKVTVSCRQKHSRERKIVQKVTIKQVWPLY